MYRQTDKITPTASLEEMANLRELPRPVYGHRDTLPNRAISEPHQHTWGQLSHTLSGLLQVETPTARYLAPPGQAVWIPPDQEHAVLPSGQPEIRSLYISRNWLPLAADRCLVIQISPLLRELIQAFSLLPVDYDQNSAQGRLTQVLLDQLALAPGLPLVLPWPRDRRLLRLCQQLQQEPSLQQGLDAFGQQIGVTGKTLTRLFYRETGMSFRQWRQRCRILSALPGLQQGQRITDIALNAGYASQSAFIAAFREQLGQTPGRFFAHQQSRQQLEIAHDNTADTA
ncbi:AraC family transcriptional regulator [Marinospirillum perlucidum]|uniref:AraC family transcriptional regulator n=1 Tax=Marinospirillum perlucidum TaxID=1982602 RepID=UPI000DF2F3EF|nr:helix-turn-helix transcriptional regulator [Marinospirillum perlucidum]